MVKKKHKKTPTLSCTGLTKPAFLPLPWNSPICCDWPAARGMHKATRPLGGSKAKMLGANHGPWL